MVCAFCRISAPAGYGNLEMAKGDRGYNFCSRNSCTRLVYLRIKGRLEYREEV